MLWLLATLPSRQWSFFAAFNYDLYINGSGSSLQVVCIFQSHNFIILKPATKEVVSVHPVYYLTMIILPFYRINETTTEKSWQVTFVLNTYVVVHSLELIVCSRIIINIIILNVSSIHQKVVNGVGPVLTKWLRRARKLGSGYLNWALHTRRWHENKQGLGSFQCV